MNARILGLLLISGCATSPAPTSGSSPETDPTKVACDLFAPELSLRVWRDVEQGRLVRERIDVGNDGSIDHTVEYTANGDVIEATSDNTRVASTTRFADREESEWVDPPRKDVTYFESGRRVRTEIDDMAGVSAGADGKIDAVRTYRYDGGDLVEEQLIRGETVMERTTHVYEDGRRVATTVEELAVKPPRIKTLLYTYENGRCLATVQP